MEVIDFLEASTYRSRSSSQTKDTKRKVNERNKIYYKTRTK